MQTMKRMIWWTATALVTVGWLVLALLGRSEYGL